MCALQAPIEFCLVLRFVICLGANANINNI